jgi:hypothetical protein
VGRETNNRLNGLERGGGEMDVGDRLKQFRELKGVSKARLKNAPDCFLATSRGSRRLAAVASFACVHAIRDNLPGNDLYCGTWDYEYSQQLDSQSRVWTLKGAVWNYHQSGCS